jgi:hypothetical protein
MTSNACTDGNIPRRGKIVAIGAALILALPLVPAVCTAQSQSQNDKSQSTARERTTKPESDAPPLTDVERAELLQVIRNLQERMARLESQLSGAGPSNTPDAKTLQAPALASGAPAEPISKVTEPESTPVNPGNETKQSGERNEWGAYTPNLGFKVADTEHGDLNVSIYTYVRYLNQMGLDSTYQDAFGNTKSVQRRQDIQIQKLQFKFLGWILNPRLRYFLYAWTSNATQGQGAQVVLAGNLNYTFNKYVTFGGGIKSLPGTRSVEGNFPFWPGVDSRMITDEYMRPSYTSGFWVTGEITDRLKYQVMLGNNMSTLGVPATRLDNGLNTWSSALVWYPTGDFEKGFSGQGWGDYEHHDNFSTRLGGHFSRSDENKESQPGSDVFENTQIRLSDGTVIFTPDLFGPGVTITDARWRMTSFDGAFKYRGFALEGEYFQRWIDNFKFLEGVNPSSRVKDLFDHGFQIQGSAMVVPQTLQAYVGHSKIFGEFGKPWDLRFGVNWFPFKSKVVRWNTEGLYLYKSPVGYSSVPFAVGGRGFVFHSSWELAF